jgi:ADP-ribosylglycohydrolase
MLVTVQAVLLSQAMSEQFISFLTQRLGWYQRLQPIAYAKFWVGSMKGPHLITPQFGDDPLVRAIVLSVIMQGHHDGALGWIQESTQLSYANRWVTQASFLVATTTQVAQFQGTAHQANAFELLEDLKVATGSKEIANRIDALIDAKSQNQSVLQVSKILSGQNRWQDHLIDNALLAIYCYVRHPDRIEEGLLELSQLRGDLRGVMPIYGAFAAIHSSINKIPSRWRERLSLYPYSSQWVQQYIDRCADWPHGPEDIQATRCLPSHMTGQWIRNLCRGFS